MSCFFVVLTLKNDFGLLTICGKKGHHEYLFGQPFLAEKGNCCCAVISIYLSISRSIYIFFKCKYCLISTFFGSLVDNSNLSDSLIHT